MEPINAINKKRQRKKKTFQYRSYNDAAFDAIESELDKIDWSVVINDDAGNDKLELFNHKLYNMFDGCFPLCSLRVTNSRQWFRSVKKLIDPVDGDVFLEVDEI